MTVLVLGATSVLAGNLCFEKGWRKAKLLVRCSLKKIFLVKKRREDWSLRAAKT